MVLIDSSLISLYYLNSKLLSVIIKWMTLSDEGRALTREISAFHSTVIFIKKKSLNLTN